MQLSGSVTFAALARTGNTDAFRDSMDGGDEMTADVPEAAQRLAGETRAGRSPFTDAQATALSARSVTFTLNPPGDPAYGSR